MLDFIRDRAQSFGVKLIFGVIILVFVFWGVGNMGGTPTGALAVVNGENISVQEFNKLFLRVADEQRKLNPDLLSNPEMFKAFKRQVLAQVIFSRLRQQEAARLGLLITPHELKRTFDGFPVFQNAEGKFDPALYARVVASQGVSQGEFEAEYSKQLLEEKLLRYIAMSVDVNEAEARTLYDFSLEKRKAEYVLFSTVDYKDKVVVSDEDISQYYANNKELFRKPALANIEFLRLTPDSLAAGYPVTDQEAEEYYEKNKLQFFLPESFLVRHIFITAPTDEDDAPLVKERREKARAVIEDIAKQLEDGADFAELAAKYSEDKISAAAGGLSEWLHKGQVGSDIFDEAALALAPGEISKPVHSEAGFHIIKLEEKKAASTPPFADVKKDIVAAIGKEKANADFINIEKTAEEGLDLNTPFAELGEKFHVAVIQTGLIPQTEAEAQVAPAKDARQPLSDAVAGLAAAPAGEDGKAPAPVTIPYLLNTDGGVALVRVLEAKASAVPPLDDVRDAIVDRIKGEKATALAHAAAEEALPRFTGKQAPQEFADKLKETGDVARVFPVVPPLGQLPELVDGLFASSGEGEWLPKVFTTSEGAIIARTKSVESMTDDNWNGVKEIFISQLRQRRQKEAVDAFMQNLVDSAKITESPEVLDNLSLR